LAKIAHGRGALPFYRQRVKIESPPPVRKISVFSHYVERYDLLENSLMKDRANDLLKYAIIAKK